MAASVRIESKAFEDPRFGILARLLGFADGLHALAKVARVWQWQAEEYAPDSPTYVVPNDILEYYLGLGAGEALVKSRLAYSEPVGSDGSVGYRMRGTEGRIEWLYAKRQNGKKGGRPSKPEPVGLGLGLQSGNQAGTDIEPEPNPLSPSPLPSPLPTSRAEPPKPPKGGSKGPSRKLTIPEVDRSAAAAVLAKLGEQTGIAYRTADSHVKLIIARYRDGFDELDLRKVIAFAARPKTDGGLGWNSDEKMRMFLRPETLFGPQTIERYLDAARSWFAQRIGGDPQPSAEFAAWRDSQDPQPRLAVVK